MTRPAESKKRASKLRQAEDDKSLMGAALNELTLIMKAQAKEIEELRARCSALYEANVKLSEEKARLSRESVLLKSREVAVDNDNVPVVNHSLLTRGDAW